MNPNGTKLQLKNKENCGTIDIKRRIELWQHLIRLTVAILYLLCEMQLGQVPDEVKIGKADKKE